MELSLFDGDESVDSGRRCASCGEPFTMYANGAGTKYCSTACKREGYTRAARSPGPPPPSVICPICDIKFSRNVGRGGYKYCSPECRRESAKRRGRPDVSCAWCGRPGRPGGNSGENMRERWGWPYVCLACLAPLRSVLPRLRMHRVSAEKARTLLTSPGCEVCGTDLLVRIRPVGGGYSARLAVDHDHACCPGPTSCGQCVRGFLCPGCNMAEGNLDGDPDRAEALASYMRRWQVSRIATPPPALTPESRRLAGPRWGLEATRRMVAR